MSVTVGVDIGGTAVRAAALDTRRRGRTLTRYATMPLPRGAVVAGEIVDEGAVGEAVAALFRQAKLPTRRVVVGTANQRLVVRRVDVPRMGEEELVEALPYQVQDSIPLAVEDALLDFVPLEPFVTPEGEPMLAILVVAIHRDAVGAILRALAAAHVEPAAIDLQPFALVRAAFGIEPAFERPREAIVDIGASVTQVVIGRGGVAEFVRLLPRGGDDFTEVLVKGAGLPWDHAEERKREVGVVPPRAEDDDSGEEARDEEAVLRRLLTREADGLVEEVKGSVSFHLSQGGEGGLTRLLVAGNGARLPHLANRLSAALGVPVRPVKVLEHIDLGRVGLGEQAMLDAQPVLPTAVGLALWGMA